MASFLGDRLGIGAFGEVWTVTHRNNQEVARKFFNAHHQHSYDRELYWLKAAHPIRFGQPIISKYIINCLVYY